MGLRECQAGAAHGGQPIPFWYLHAMLDDDHAREKGVAGREEGVAGRADDVARPFCGRSEQLDALLSCWQEVRSGLAGPRIVVLLAEAGMGKTRLAQQFYDRLVALEQGGDGYWPPHLGHEGNNLLVNPPAASWDAAADMPFLWWGIRLADPAGHNQVATGGLSAHVDSYLVPHLAAFHREQRRRQRLLQLAKVGGAVAADAIVDLVPFLGLLKKVGEVGLELKGIHDSWRQDRRVLDAATLLEERRDSLVDQLMADLDKLFTGPAGRRVPAVILVDDAQFSAADPGVTALMSALVPAMTAASWPVLLLVTHWEREYAAGVEGGSPIAALIEGHARQELDAVKVLRLTPIAGLEPLVTGRLPGLTPEQVGSLTSRAGGNPRFLDEIVRVALDPRNRGMFEGRNSTNAMTDAGLESLLAKSVKLHDVVAERFASSPEEVQRAVTLAGLQGARFVRSLVADTMRALDAESGAVDPEGAGETVGVALEEAERRHAFLASLTEFEGEFSQRIYLDVAKEFLPAFYDEDAVGAGLRRVVSDVLTGVTTPEFDTSSLTRLWQLGVTLFETSDDVEERRYAAHCLHLLSRAMRESGELQVAYATALRQATVLESLPDESLDGDLAWLRAVNDTLAAVGDLDAQRPVLTRLVSLTGATYDDDVNTWSAGMYAEALLDVADFHAELGQSQLRSEALAMAVDVMASLDDLSEDLAALETSLRLHRTYGEWLVERGEVAAAADVQRAANDIAGHLAAADDGPGRRFDLAVARRNLARTSVLRGDTDAAIAAFESAATELRELLALDSSVTLEIQLVTTLDDLADTLEIEERDAEAETLRTECLAIMRRHLTLAPEAARTRSNLADALERLALARTKSRAYESAWDMSREAVELRRAVVMQTGSGSAESALGVSLARAAEIAARRGAVEDGYGPAREALSLLRAAHEREGNARSAWRLVYAIKVAVPHEVAHAGLAAARTLLSEADAVYQGQSDEAKTFLDDEMEGIGRYRATVLQDGDALGADTIGVADTNGVARSDASAVTPTDGADARISQVQEDFGPN